MDRPASLTHTPGKTAEAYRQLLLGVLAMMAISSAQYTWTLFVSPLQHALGASLAAVQVTFSLFVVLQTFLAPLQGYLVDGLGPRPLLSIGASLMTASWVLAAHAGSLGLLYASYGVLGGLGSGIIYIGVMGLVVSWFPDRRGFAAGVAAAGYGMGAILTTFPIASMIREDGYHHTLLVFGIAQGLVAWLAAQGLRLPRAAGDLACGVVSKGPAGVQRGPASIYAMLRSPVFWCLFVMMVMMSTGGLMIISQIAVFARDFGVAHAFVWGVAALPLAMSLDRLTNGLARPFFGWASDRLGRETTMAAAFGLEAVAVALLLYESHDALAFILLSGAVFFGWGEIFALFPATLIDTFGGVDAATKYGFLYMAQGVGALAGGPLAALVYEREHSWTGLFVAVVALDGMAALLALGVLWPLRRRHLARSRQASAPTPAT